MRRFLIQQWFLIGLLIFIPLGFVVGGRIPDERMHEVNEAFGSALTRGLTGAVLLLMSVTLNTNKLVAALRAPKAVLWATAVNALAMPAIAWPLVRMQLVRDFEMGLMIAASVPCTMAAASVWTRAAGGNDAISLLVTTLTNGLCFLITPFWLEVVSRASKIDLASNEMVLVLVLGGLAPIVAGQLARIVPAVARFADGHKLALGATAQLFLLIQVVWACMQAGPSVKTGIDRGDGWNAVAVVWVSSLILHGAGLALAYCGARAIGLSREDQIAAAFAGSQKTLPIGVMIALLPQIKGPMPFAIIPMLMYHASQLVIDTVVAARLKAPPPPEAGEEEL